jgi:hypothetical protein
MISYTLYTYIQFIWYVIISKLFYYEYNTLNRQYNYILCMHHVYTIGIDPHYIMGAEHLQL